MMPMAEGVSIPFVARLIDAETGILDPGAPQAKAAAVMLDEILRWAEALRVLRVG